MCCVCANSNIAATLQKKKEEPAPNATLQVTGAVSWRREGLRYKKNGDCIAPVDAKASGGGNHPKFRQTVVFQRLGAPAAA